MECRVKHKDPLLYLVLLDCHFSTVPHYFHNKLIFSLFKVRVSNAISRVRNMELKTRNLI